MEKTEEKRRGVGEEGREEGRRGGGEEERTRSGKEERKVGEKETFLALNVLSLAPGPR